MPLDPYTLEQAEEDIAFLRGQVDRLSEILSQNDGPVPNTPAASGYAQSSAGGIPRQVSFDGNTYGGGVLFQAVNGTLPQVIASTTPANVQGLSCLVVNGGVYRVTGRLSCTIGGTSTTIKLQVTGPAITSMEVGYMLVQNNPGGATVFTATQTAISTLAQPTTVNQGNGTAFTVLLDGVVTFSAAGTMTLGAAEATNLQTWQVNANSFWVIHRSA